VHTAASWRAIALTRSSNLLSEPWRFRSQEVHWYSLGVPALKVVIDVGNDGDRANEIFNTLTSTTDGLPLTP